MKNYQVYPIISTQRLTDKLITMIKKWPIKCPVCNHYSFIKNINIHNIRESCFCGSCNSTNRQRQLATTICQTIGIKSLAEIPEYHGYIYNTESFGPIHNQLLKARHYTFSEYFGPKYQSGQIIKNTMHQDLMKLSFKKGVFDLVISSDVLEHVSRPYKAHREIYRVLKKDGSHIFTVPFLHSQILDDKRALISADKIKFLKEAKYHLDGIRPRKGALVFNIFSMEMLVELSKIGFNVQMYKIFNPLSGIIGNNAFVFCATK